MSDSLRRNGWNSSGKNTGVGCHCLLQEIFPTQESNPGLLHCRWIPYHLSYQRSSELPYDHGISFLSIYLKKSINQKDTCTLLFISVVFTIVKTWKQPKCPSIEEWIKKTWYIYEMEYYSVIKKKEIIPFASIWMDLESIILSEVSHRRRNLI